MTNNYKILWMSVVGLALFAGTSAFAQDPGSCCVQSTSRLDQLLNPTKGSDEKFFTSGGGPPNVLFVFDTSCSMADWPQDWPSGAGAKGCNHPGIADLGFDPAGTYQPMVSDIVAGAPVYNTKWWDITQYYDAPQRGYGTDFTGNPINANTGGAIGKWATPALACAAFGADAGACATCLTTKGYWVQDGNNRRIWGKFLNFYAPRDSGAVLVMSHLINDIRNVRFGLQAFGATSGHCFTGNRICNMVDTGPECANSFPLNTAAVSSNRSDLEQALQNDLSFGGATPMSSALYAAGHYFKNKAGGPDPFSGWFGGGYPHSGNFDENLGADKKSICASCGFNAIILITDGEPNSEVIPLPAAITGQAVTCVSGSCISLDPARVAKWWWEHDMRNDYTGNQKVATYTIGFAQDANSSGTLKTVAQYGGGKFFGATNTKALTDSVFAILDEVNAKNTSFSSAAIASVQSSGSSFAAILPRFSPQPNLPWVGSLRRFNLFNEFIEDYNLNPGELQADGTLDADKSDIWVVDTTMPAPPYPPAVPLATARVIEDVDGQFVRWDGVTPATPYWEAGSKLVAMGFANRKVYTVIDDNSGAGGDGSFTSNDSMVAFTAANSAVLGNYMGIKGTAFCPSFVGALVCNGGPRNGQSCAVLADCPVSSYCVGGANDTLACSLDADCPGSAGGTCQGGPNNHNPCVADSDCGHHGCHADHKCASGAACATDVDCPFRDCAAQCVGGWHDGWNCSVPADCPGGGSCPAGSAAGVCTPGVVTCAASGAGTVGDMLTKLGLSVNGLRTELAGVGIVVGVPASQADLDDLCVKGLIQYMRGQDLGDEDGDGNRAETRRSVLGDIFHSSPVVVDPPVDKFLCDIGLHNQCVRTIYSKNLGPTVPTPQDAPGGQVNCSGTGVTRDAYEAYQWIHRKRDRVILVGANDGMLHAFQNSNATSTCVGGTETIDYPAIDPIPADPGTEAWAFVPPDMMPRLQEYVFGHTYFVDGDIMVRDIWEDKNGDGRKTYDEFHTVAVVADGRGGTHYFALEIRFTTSAATFGLPVGDLTVGQLANNIAAPGFRWMFPQPCSDDASLFGKTLLSLSPKPPAIGPVLLERNSIVNTPGFALKPTAGTNRYACSDGTTPCDTTERWVVMMGGGWSPSSERGRGFYMVDAWNGKVNGRSDNLLWKMDYDPTASGEQDFSRSQMRYSITAPVAMVDYGSNTKAQLDGFFDTATVGDVGGQMWLARFFKPGKYDPATKLISNWTGTRTFEMDLKGDPNANGDHRKVGNLWPFYYITSAGVQPDNGALRIFTGTGNRYSLLEPNAGECRFDNPLACAKYKCDETSVEYKIEKNTLKLDKAKMHWDKDEFKGNEADQGTSVVGDAVCGAAGSTVVTASLKQVIKGCDPESGPKEDYNNVRDLTASCGTDAAGNFSCRRTDLNTPQLGDLGLTPKIANLSALNNNRFFGFWAYGGPDATRVFEEDKDTSGAWKTAKDYDGTRLSDRTTGDGAKGDLVDVTTTTCTTATACVGPQATGGGKGWFYTYSGAGLTGLTHHTASGSALLASCVLWNEIYPATAATTCGVSAVATGRFNQANFITGAPNCAAGFKDPITTNFVRGIDRGIQAPPPEPAQSVQISKTGQIRYSALLIEPGSKQATEATITSASDALQSVYEIPVSRSDHKCRHTAGGSGNCVELAP